MHASTPARLVPPLSPPIQEEVFSPCRETYLVGTFASADYFAHLRPRILHEFSFKSPPSGLNAGALDHIRSTTALCVHVRRGDYVTNPGTHASFGTCEPDYYQRAFDLLAPHAPNPHAFIFSDDPDWTRIHLRLPCSATLISHNVGRSAIEDLRPMAACRHFIIANSTFSWWAAWLCEQPDKQIVAHARSNDPSTINDPCLPTWRRT
jgi:hypothetical protein